MEDITPRFRPHTEELFAHYARIFGPFRASALNIDDVIRFTIIKGLIYVANRRVAPLLISRTMLYLMDRAGEWPHHGAALGYFGEHIGQLPLLVDAEERRLSPQTLLQLGKPSRGELGRFPY